MSSTDTLPDIEELRGAVAGRVLLPLSAGYDEIRQLWNGRCDHRPAGIVRCEVPSDVVAAVAHARAHELVVSVRGGGHHVSGDAVCGDTGLMVDMAMMDVVEVDPERRVARVGPGARARDLNEATQPFGLGTTVAPIASCGIAGHTLGGGTGWMSRKRGLACDNLLSAEVVTADGRLVRAAEDENDDLFWALRGGSGNFGVVTSFEFRLHEIGPAVCSGRIIHPLDGAAGVLRAWGDYMATAPDELACVAFVFMLPPVPSIPHEHHGETVLALVPFYDGEVEAGMEAIAPLREVGSPLVDEVGAVRYLDLLADLDRVLYRAGDRVACETAFFDELSEEAIGVLIDRAAPVPSAFSSICIEWLGGAAGRISADATAYPHRARQMCVTAVPKWKDEARDGEMIGWATRMLESLTAYAAPGQYVNYLDRRDGSPEVPDPARPARNHEPDGAARAVYGDNYERLREIKALWDPGNLFRMNHNIRPAR